MATNGGREPTSMKRCSLFLNLIICLGAVASGPGCATRQPGEATASSPEPPTMLAVLPERWLTTTRSVDVNGAALIAEVLGSTPGIAVVAPERCAEAMTAEDAECSRAPECVRRVGTSLGADWVVMVELAEFGGTVILRATMSQVRGTRQETRQERVQDASREQIVGAMQRIGRGFAEPLAPSPEPPPRPWYRRWWPWTIVGVTLAGVGISVATVLTMDRGEDPPPP